MGRITQAQATEVSKKLVEKIQVEIDNERKALSEYITDIYKPTIPKDVMRLWDKGQKWLKQSSSIYVSGQGISSSYATVSFVESKALPVSNTNDPRIELTPEQANEYCKRKGKIEDLKNKKERTYKEIYNLLLSMTTWKRALEALPELEAYVPKEEKATGLMIIPSATKEKIKCLINKEDKTCLNKI
jgi:hypothetical protein